MAEGVDQVLTIEPAVELLFKGPFTDMVTVNLDLTNPSDKRVCWKVMTTAPKRYCVRPNGGVLGPQQSVTVAVMLQPFENGPNEKSQHKFLVKTMFAPDGNIENQQQLWKDVSPDKVMTSKLESVLDQPDSEAKALLKELQKEEQDLLQAKEREELLKQIVEKKQAVKQLKADMGL